MNCSSESRRLQRLLGQLWQELRGGGGGGGRAGSPSPPNGSAGGSFPPGLLLLGAEQQQPRPQPQPAAGADDAYLYILLIMIFYGCLAGGLILAYTRSRKLESKHDPYHLYIERDWPGGAAGALGGPEAAGLEEEAAAEPRQSSADSQHL
ncbi:potassium voltage-gated channel subfamily E regulatory beta subunit 5 [Hemicordylus capensis]|uniref:potassium voltage-gated channel subfamily E regulatory beta subunit 5 n=1 Tax=Hemicordylus capensis TaxID=884348 RepID=UPI00230362A8|nr:potassium voltage-gated channel subfamily E regulatory beta subunit 5 [Hemicordylus capensis]